MSATCDKCWIVLADAPGYLAITLCPLHAEAEAMRGVLARAVRLVEQGSALAIAGAGAAAAARPILARIEGKAE